MSAIIALEVLLNGRRVCIAGGEDLAVLTASLSIAGRLGPKTVQPEPRDALVVEGSVPEPHVRVGGLTCRGPDQADEHLDWVPDLVVKPGDTLSVRVVEVNAGTADAPAREVSTSEPTFDANERRMFEIARDTYLALRAKYGGGDA